MGDGDVPGIEIFASEKGESSDACRRASRFPLGITHDASEASVYLRDQN